MVWENARGTAMLSLGEWINSHVAMKKIIQKLMRVIVRLEGRSMFIFNMYTLGSEKVNNIY